MLNVFNYEIWNPNYGWVAEDDKIWSGNSLSRIVDVESLVGRPWF